MRPLVMIIVLLLGSTAYAQQLKSITNSIGMKLVLIHAGSFTMGSLAEVLGKNILDNGHEVALSNSFYLGVYEVTQEQYEKVKGENPCIFKGAKNPVENVSWEDAVSFCKMLSDLPEERTAGRVYRLPTEAEWEYACRANSTTEYCFGDSDELLTDYAWFGDLRGGETHPVGKKKLNRWGLYDMHGNVWEWCQDWYSDSLTGYVTDPQGPSIGSQRVHRGGSWANDAANCRTGYRDSNVSTYRTSYIGFRVAMSLPATKPGSASTK